MKESFKTIKHKNAIQIIEIKSRVVIGHVEDLNYCFVAVPYFGHKQKSVFTWKEFAQGYVISCFRGKMSKPDNDIQLKLRI